jgi:CBS-domain-containing membrane protein
MPQNLNRPIVKLREIAMKIARKTLPTMTAADLMSRGVVTLREAMSLKEAAQVLSQTQISGAPVVDEEGRCIGVLSAVDFVRWKEKVGETPESHQSHEWQPTNRSTIPKEKVAQYMTPDPETVPLSTPVRQLARQMVDARIHRLIVLDDRDRPIGVISSTDILAAVAYGLGG